MANTAEAAKELGTITQMISRKLSNITCIHGAEWEGFWAEKNMTTGKVRSHASCAP